MEGIDIGATGDAPVSAFNTETTAQEFAQMESSEPTQDSGIDDVFMITPERPSEPTNDEPITTDTVIPPAPERESRYPPGTTCDGNGPYGTIDDPYYEGEDIDFTATINGDDIDNYQFRWDVNSDGQFDGPGPAADDFWGDYGDPDYTHTFLDNNMQDALVQAWDGSMKSYTGGGNLLDNTTSVGWYMGGYYYGTIGQRFTLTQDVSVDRLGIQRWYYPYQYYNIRLWDADTQTILAQVNNPYVPYYSWRWFNIASVDLTAGDYMLSVYVRGYYQVGDDNPVQRQMAYGTHRGGPAVLVMVTQPKTCRRT
jgi:hypothetical protein